MIQPRSQCAVLTARQPHAAGRRQFLAAADVVVKEQPEPHLPAWPQLRHMRQDELHRPDDVRRDLQ
jgi:hypothetical protein